MTEQPMSLLERIKVRKAAEAAGTRSHTIKPADVELLRGTGITKRALERGQKQYEREAEQSMQHGEAAEAEASAKFSHAIEETMAAILAENRRDNIILDASQLRAVRGILMQRVSCLIGAAGTGKTTVTKIIIQQLAKHIAIVDLREAYWVTLENEDGTKSRVLATDVEREPEQKRPAICGASFTGRAAQQFKKVLPEEWQSVISTIHSLLGYAPVFEDYDWQDPITKVWQTKTRRMFRPSFGESCKLPFVFYILDEASMIPIALFNELVDAMPKGARILFIGDIHQLPPVYGKGVLGYALRKYIPAGAVFELTEIHRQAAGNAIIANAHRILKGHSLQKASNFQLIDIRTNSQSEAQLKIRDIVRRLNELGRYDPYRDTIILPQNKSLIGALDLNLHFVTMFNQEKKENGIVVNKRQNIHTGTNHVHFATGDKVMINSNINTETPPITNGMLGVVESIRLNGKYDQKRAQVNLNAEPDEDEDGSVELDMEDFNLILSDESDDKKKEEDAMDQRQSSHVMTIKFESGQTYVCSTAGDFRKISFGYAVTCHKMQGGECPNVIIVVHSSNAALLSQEWLYTAVTRARLNVYIIYNTRGLEMAIKRQRIKGNTLEEKIRSYIIEAKADDAEFDENDPFHVDRTQFPILFNPERVEA